MHISKSSVTLMLAFALSFLVACSLVKEDPPQSCVEPFKHCSEDTSFELPNAWRSMVLMTPFSEHDAQGNVGVLNQLVRADIIFDYRINTQLSRTYEVNTGEILETLLATKADNSQQTEVFKLFKHTENSYQCERITDDSRFAHWTFPNGDWLTERAKHYGEHSLRQIGATSQSSNKTLVPYIEADWWKVPVDFVVSEGKPAPAQPQVANWLLVGKKSKLPYRIMNSARDVAQRLPLLGDYSINYFLNARAVQNTHLREVRELCLSEQAIPAGLLRFEKEVAGLEFLPAKVTRDRLPSFQSSFESNALMTPISVADFPFKTQIKYDWDNVRMLTTLFTDALEPASAAFLQPDHGRVTNCSGEQAGIQPITLGAPQTNWMNTGHCKIASVMASQGFENTLVIGCPVNDIHSVDGARTFWMWYSANGVPYSFMESEAELGVGTSLSLADYYDWKRAPVSLSTTADENFCRTEQPVLEKSNMPKGCYGCHGGRFDPNLQTEQ